MADPRILRAARDEAGPLPQVIEDTIAAHEGPHPSRALAILRAVAAARKAGAEVEDRLPIDDHDVLRIRHQGLPAALAVCAVDFPSDGPGDPVVVQKLLDAIETVMGPYEHGILLRRPVPTGFEPAPVARAVHLWRLSMDRGEWQGRQAIYDDERAALDIYVLKKPGEGGRPGRVAAVPPLRAMGRLELAYRAVAGVVDRLVDERIDLPLVVAVDTSDKLHIPRGHLFTLLYGMPDEIDVTDGRWVGTWRASGTSMYSEASFRETAAVWWLTDGVAHENPWCVAPGAPRFPGRRFAAIAPVIGSLRRASMAWTDGDEG